MKERILIVEDNKALSKLMTKKMSQNLDFEIIQAYSMADVERELEENDDFFVALLDLNLPDAPDGEVVDFVLSYGIPSIILTGNIDDELREEMFKKDIIDYVFKGNIEDVNYIFSLIERLSKNRDIKVMIVDDSLVSRKEVKRILESQMFKVLVAAHGEEALSYLEDNSDVKLVLTDYNMPVINGVELTKEIRQKYSKNDMIIIAMTGSNEALISAKFLKIGANDFITKPFSREELICRVNNTLDTKEYLDKISNMAHIDFLTNLNNRRYFFEKVEEFIKSKKDFAIGMIDIDLFKKFNDTYGHEGGDTALRHLARILKENTKGSDIVSRFGGEEFCIALKDVDEKKAVSFFVKLRKIIAESRLVLSGKEADLTVSIGVSFSQGRNNIEDIINEADEALYKAKNSGRNRVEIA